MKDIAYNLMNQIQWNQLQIQIKDMPENVYAEASGNTISLSWKFIKKIKNGTISKPYFLFVFLHEIVHIAQQSILSLKMTKQELNGYVEKNRILLEEDANEIASKLIFSKKRKSLLNLFFDKTKCKSINLCNSTDVTCQYWMVDGFLAEKFAGESNCGSLHDRKKEFETAVKDFEGQDDLKSKAEALSDRMIGLHTDAITSGIHETFTRDALTSLKKFFEIHKNHCVKLETKECLSIEFVDNGNWLSFIDKSRNTKRNFDMKSVEIGSQWNDRSVLLEEVVRDIPILGALRSRNISFITRYIFQDRFLQSSHNSRMQFLHSMDCSGGCKGFNLKKIKRWVSFCLDVYKNIKINGKSIREITINEYIDFKNDDLFRNMMHDLYYSYYGDYITIKYFFTKKLGYDVGSVAIGSVVHMIQDSFASSHVKRCLDPFLVQNLDTLMDVEGPSKQEANSKDCVYADFHIENEALIPLEKDSIDNQSEDKYEKLRIDLQRKAMPVIAYANYKDQKSGRHSHADIFLKKYHAIETINPEIKKDLNNDYYRQTLNSTMAKNCSEVFIYMVAMGFEENEILNFIESIYPSFEIKGDVTKSGSQYCKEGSVDKYYETIMESFLCYNVKDSLAGRVVIYDRAITLLKSIANKNRSIQCQMHFNEIVNEIMVWTYMLTERLRSNKEDANFCKESASFLLSLIKKIESYKLFNYDSKIKETVFLCKAQLDTLAKGNKVSKALAYESDDPKESMQLGNLFKDFFKTSEELFSKEICYYVWVFTGDKFCAGTDATIHITINGTKGFYTCSDLDNLGNSFEKNSIEFFEIYSSSDFGDIKNIIIGHNGDDWLLDKIIIVNISNKKSWLFGFNRVIKKYNDVMLKEPSIIGSCFVVETYTSDISSAGTNANVYITIEYTDVGGKTGFINRNQLDNSKDNFEAGDYDSFVLHTKDKVNNIKSITIEHDGSGAGDAWHLDKIEITDVISGKRWEFIINDWLEKNKPIERKPKKVYIPMSDSQAEESSVPEVSSPKTIGTDISFQFFTTNYSVVLDDSHVHITVQGSNNKVYYGDLSQGLDLKEPIKRNDAPSDLGDIKSITLGHTSSCGGNRWTLSKVIVKYKTQSLIFLANTELKEDADETLLPVPSCFLLEFFITGNHGVLDFAKVGMSVSIVGLVEEKKMVTLPYEKIDFGSKDVFSQQSDYSFIIASEDKITEIKEIKLKRKQNDYKIGDDVCIERIVITELASLRKYSFALNRKIINIIDDGVIIDTNGNIFKG